MPTITDRYDRHFKTYADIYFHGLVAWQWFKTMAIAESGLDPRAKSPAGALGIMQLMPSTSAEVAKELWLADDPYNAQINILMGIHYAKRMWNIFKKEEGLERLCFMLGAYNAGARNIIKAQAIAVRPDIWDDIAAVLPLVTKRHARETIDYVARIKKIKQEIISG